MFHLAVMACLAAEPAICAERMLPAPDQLTETDCQKSAVERLSVWGRQHDNLRLGDWRCLTVDALPALSLTEIVPGVFVHNPPPAPLTPENGGDIANLGRSDWPR